ncbi:MAG: hypothetical protein GWN62_16965 [Aliifodinibius sp.]|nr:hypothetical protein [Fodinibius sp.]
MKIPALYQVGEELAKIGRPVCPGKGLHDKQQQVFDSIVSKTPDEHTFVIGGSFGGGKSFGALTILNTLALRYPGSRFVVIRETSRSCRESVYMDFKNYFKPYCERVLYENTNPDAVYHNGSVIHFRGENLKDDPALDQWKSFGCTGFFIEQLENISERFYEIAVARTGRWKQTGSPEFVLASVNPTPEWPIHRFWQRHQNGTLPDSIKYIPMHITENPSLSEKSGYMSRFDDMDEVMKRAFLDGDWSVMLQDEFGQLFPNEWINQAVERHKAIDSFNDITSIGVDIARGGNDETSFAIRSDHHIKEIISYPGIDTPDGKQLIQHLMDVAPSFKGSIIMDLIGVGSSPYDVARELWGERVLGFNAGGKTNGRTDNSVWGFANLKAHIYWHFRERLNPKNENPIAIPDDPLFLADLRSVRFKIRGDKIQIDSKEDMRKKLGRSPDRAEAAIISYYPEIRNSFDLSQLILGG